MPRVPQTEETVTTCGTRSIRLGLLFAISLSFLLLTACTSRRHSYTKTDQRTPTRTPASQRPYTVDGKRYEPLASHEGFRQEGVASSYGSDFHGRKTSSGEPFDMHAMTAAHKTLPLGVYVRVRHKRNGNEIIVRINDRGPFVRDRIIDLSEAAAARLDMLREGLAQVQIEALGYKNDASPTSSPTYRPPASYDAGSFGLQVGAFTIKANAHRYADELRRSHGTADVQEALVNGTRYYRVRLGRYTSLTAAQAAQTSFEHKGFPGCFVVALD